MNQITAEDKLTIRMVFSELAKLTIGDVNDIMINTPKATLPNAFLQRYGTGINIIDQQHKLLWEMIIQISVLKGNAFAFSRGLFFFGFFSLKDWFFGFLVFFRNLTLV